MSLRFCDFRQEIPDDELVASLFSEASKDSGRPCSPPPWVISGSIDVPGDPLRRALHVYLPSQLTYEGKNKELMFLMGNYEQTSYKREFLYPT